jgi:hypothetical protein
MDEWIELEEYPGYFINRNGLLTLKNSIKSDFKNLLKGKISYLKSTSSDVKKQFIGKILNPLNQFIIYPDFMNKFQSEIYKKAYNMDLNIERLKQLVVKENINRKQFIQDYGKYLTHDYVPELKITDLKLSIEFNNQEEISNLPNILNEEEESALNSDNIYLDYDEFISQGQEAGNILMSKNNLSNVERSAQLNQLNQVNQVSIRKGSGDSTSMKKNFKDFLNSVEDANISLEVDKEILDIKDTIGDITTEEEMHFTELFRHSEDEIIRLFEEGNNRFLLCCYFIKALALYSDDFYNNLPNWLIEIVNPVIFINRTDNIMLLIDIYNNI